MVDFVKPLSEKNIDACKSLIAQLKTNHPDEVSFWEQTLVALVHGIEQNYHHETLLALLQELPAPINEALFAKLISSSNVQLPVLKTLVEYVNKIPSADNAHQVNLIYSLLSAPVSLADQPKVVELILKLKANEQANLLIRLKNLADIIYKKQKEKRLVHITNN